jgi:hypothetical protein
MNNNNNNTCNFRYKCTLCTLSGNPDICMGMELKFKNQ